MANEYVFLQTSSNDIAYQEEGHWEATSLWGIGWDKDPGFDNKMNGALRIPSLPIARGTSIYSADIVMENCSRQGENIYGKLYGIAEDNTGDFNGNNPWLRARTSANNDIYMYQPSGNTTFGVTSMVQEIINRSGWNTNNAIGFVWVADNLSNHNSQSNYLMSESGYLYIRFAQPPNLTPTPITVSAPTFPASRGYGLKISLPGVDVKTATASQLLYTSDKEYMKILSEGQISTTANTLYLIAHGLAYTPRVLAFGRANGKSFELPRLFGGATDPVGGGLQGYISVDSTNIRIITTTNATVYFYVFLDELT